MTAAEVVAIEVTGVVIARIVAIVTAMGIARRVRLGRKHSGSAGNCRSRFIRHGMTKMRRRIGHVHLSERIKTFRIP